MTDEREETKSDGDAAPETPGLRLRRARKSAGLSVQEAAAQLRLDHWMVEALEADDYSEFGAPVFAKGHMRKYATLLDIDPDDLMIGYYQVQTPEAPPLVSASNIPAGDATERANWRRVLLLGALAAGLAALLWWGWAQWAGRDAPPARGTDAAPARSAPAPNPRETPVRAARVEPTPANDAPGTAAGDDPGVGDALAPQQADAGEDEAALPVDTDGGASMAAVPGDPPAAPSAGAPAPVADATRAAASEAQLATRRVEAASGDSPAGETAAGDVDGAATEPRINRRNYGGETDVSLRLSFGTESWVEVRDGLDRRLLYGLGREGTEESIEARAPVEIFLGNFSGVGVEVDGRPFEIPASALRGNTARFRVAASDE